MKRPTSRIRDWQRRSATAFATAHCRYSGASIRGSAALAQRYTWSIVCARQRRCGVHYLDGGRTLYGASSLRWCRGALLILEHIGRSFRPPILLQDRCERARGRRALPHHCPTTRGSCIEVTSEPSHCLPTIIARLPRVALEGLIFSGTPCLALDTSTGRRIGRGMPRERRATRSRIDMKAGADRIESRGCVRSVYQPLDPALESPQPARTGFISMPRDRERGDWLEHVDARGVNRGMRAAVL